MFTTMLTCSFWPREPPTAQALRFVPRRSDRPLDAPDPVLLERERLRRRLRLSSGFDAERSSARRLFEAGLGEIARSRLSRLPLDRLLLRLLLLLELLRLRELALVLRLLLRPRPRRRLRRLEYEDDDEDDEPEDEYEDRLDREDAELGLRLRLRLRRGPLVGRFESSTRRESSMAGGTSPPVRRFSCLPAAPRGAYESSRLSSWYRGWRWCRSCGSRW
jgi:hypothetical protein